MASKKLKKETAKITPGEADTPHLFAPLAFQYDPRDTDPLRSEGLCLRLSDGEHSRPYPDTLAEIMKKPAGES